MDANFFRTDSPSRSNGCKFFSHGYPKPFERMSNPFERLMHGIRTAIRAKTANPKERFRVRGHICTPEDQLDMFAFFSCFSPIS